MFTQSILELVLLKDLKQIIKKSKEVELLNKYFSLLKTMRKFMGENDEKNPFNTSKFY